MPDQSVIGLSREQLVELIAHKKEQFEKVLEDYDSLKREIAAMEDRLYTMGESLNNPVTCFNPIKFLAKNCEKCGFSNACVYRSKGDYGKFKLSL